MSNWPIIQFHELADASRSAFSKPYGSAITKEDYVSKGVPVVRGVNLRNGIFEDDDFVFIPEHKADGMPGANLIAGDLVFTHRGTIGQVSMIPRQPRYARYVLSTSQVKARLDLNRASPEFYYYWFTSPNGQRALLANTSTVGVPGLGQPVATIKSLRVPYPALAVQRAIADILGALDSKIAINDQVAFLCHKLAESLFQSKTRTTVQVQLSSLTDPVLGGTPDRTVSEYWRPGHLWASAKDVAGAKFGTLVVTEEQISELAAITTKAKPVPEGSVILTARGTVGAVARVTQPTAFNQSCYAFIPGSIPPAVLYLIVRAAAQQMLGVAHGTVFSTVNMKTFDHIQVPALSESELKALEAEVAPLLDVIESRVRESRSLSTLRDTVLPKLMSGEIRVRDAERFVEDAT